MARTEPPRAKRLGAGVKVPLLNLDGAPIRRVLLGATWDRHAVDIDMSAVLLDSSRGVRRREDFLYRRNRQDPDHAGFVGFVPPGRSSGPDRAQILLDLEALDPAVVGVRVSFSAVKPQAVLSETGMIKARAMDLDNAQTSFVYLHNAADLSTTTCLLLWHLQRSPDGWLIVAEGKPYPGGPPAFARDHGVTFG